MLSLQYILGGGAVLCASMTVLVLGSLLYNPRLWLQDYPEAIRKLVPALNPAEKRIQSVLLVLFLAMMLGIPCIAVAMLRADQGGSLPFLSAYAIVFLILNIANLWDAAVLDLALTFVKPSFIILPGTQAADYAALEDWGLQLRNFLKGVVFCTVASLPVALVAVL